MRYLICLFVTIISLASAKDAVVVSSDGDSLVLKGINSYQLSSVEMGTEVTGNEQIVRNENLQSLNDTDRYVPHTERKCPAKITFFKSNELSSIVLPGYSDHKYGWSILTLTSDVILAISISQYYSHYAQANQPNPRAKLYYQDRLSEDRLYLITSAITSFGFRLIYNLF